ncbi:hypothetical protein F4779DRAFT_603956 [Xylariaceae sp. FL0662B]|nr:hypothetical protein F4779DRAFT_603956 [Xylariaceae sp. FL0662B]
MAPKTRTAKIPQEDWSLHKDEILDLFLREDLTVGDLAERMKSRGLNATISQYEAQLGTWKIRKNLKVHEWDLIFKVIDRLPRDARSRILLTGHLVPEHTIERARRHCNSQSNPRKRQRLDAEPTMSDVSIEVQGQDGSWSRLTSGASVTSVSTSSQSSSSTFPQPQALAPSDHYYNSGRTQEQDHVVDHIHDSGLMSVDNRHSPEFVRTVAGYCGEVSLAGNIPASGLLKFPSFGGPAQLVQDGASPSRLHQKPASLSCFEIPFEVPSIWLERLTSMTFGDELSREVFGSSHQVIHCNGRVIQANDAMVKEFLMALKDSVVKNTEWSNIKFILRDFATLLPGCEIQAINRNKSQTMISPNDFFKTNFFRLLIFSMLNGFAGLEDMPIEDVSSFIVGMESMSILVIEFLKVRPSRNAKAFAETLFRAAIESEEDRIIGPLLATGLVHVNHTLYDDDGIGITPIFHALATRKVKVVKTLMEAGANMDGIEVLVDRDRKRPFPRNGWDFITVTEEVVRTLESLRQPYYRLFCHSSWTAEATSLCVSIMAPTNHSELIKYEFLEKIAWKFEDQMATEIGGNIVRACEQMHGGKCLREYLSKDARCISIAETRSLFDFRDLLRPYFRRSDRKFVVDTLSTQASRYTIDLDLNLHCQHPLIEAILARNMPLIRQLEERGALECLDQPDQFIAALDATGQTGNTDYAKKLLSRHASSLFLPQLTLELHRAIKNHHDELAFALLDAGVIVNYADSPTDEWCVLVAAVRRNHHQLVQAILNADIANEYSVTPIRALKEAIKWGDKATLGDLKTTFNGLLSGSFCDTLPFEDAIKANDYDMFNFLLQQEPTSESDLSRCMVIAIARDDHSMLQYLLDRGPDALINEKTLMDVAIGKPAILSQLLTHYAGRRECVVTTSALYQAIRGGLDNIESLDILLSSDIINKQYMTRFDGNVISPLGYAILECGRGNDPEFIIVGKLLDAGCSPNSIVSVTRLPYIIQQSALLEAIGTRNEKLVRFMIERGADVNAVPALTVKRSPLQHAVEIGSLGITKLLLKYKADVNAVPSIRSGGTALQFAAISGNCNIAAELLSHGALLHAPPSKVNGRWPIEGAAEHGRLHMIEYLWAAKSNIISVCNCQTGFEPNRCLRAMELAEKNGHRACKELIAELSGFPEPCTDF